MVDSKGQLIGPDRLRSISRNIRSIVNRIEDSSAEDGKKLENFEKIVADVVVTSDSPTIGAVHRVAAWNALSTLIAHSLTSNVVEIRDYLWKQGLWHRALELYLAHVQNARPKSIQQLLSALVTSLSKGCDDDTELVKEHATQTLLQAIINFDDPYRSKASAQLLSGLLGKDVVSLEEVLDDITLEHGPQVAHFSPHSVQYLLWILFQWTSKSDFGSTIAQLISRLLEKYDKNEISNNPVSDATEAPIWALPLAISMNRDLVNVDDMRAHAFPVLFKRSFGDFVSFLHTSGLTELMENKPEKSSAANEQLLCVALQSGNELGLIRTEAVQEVQQTSSALVLPVQRVGRLLLRESRMLRLTGLSLLVYSNSPLRPLSRSSFQILKNALPNFFADPDADFRSDLFSLFQKLLDRLRSVTAAQARLTKLHHHDPSLVNDGSEAAPASVIANHKQFLQWTIRFLTWDLRPTASYQRHVCSLKCLTILAKSGLDPAIPSSYLSKSALAGVQWPFEMSVLSTGLRNSLLTLLLDPFDDVRIASAIILDMYISSPQASRWLNTIESALDRATALMLASGRADQADGVAHLWALKHRMMNKGVGDDRISSGIESSALKSLVAKLEEMLNIAEADLTEAVKSYPTHGILTSLRYVVNQDLSGVSNYYCEQLSVLLHKVWEIVKPTLCNDAPEGYMPEELDIDSGSTKEILSYCWRALKEASLLLNTLVQSSRPDSNILRALCELCFAQLIELRHRGAFSTVAQTWVSCCIRSKELQSSSSGGMLETWYLKTIQMLENNITINTRRSAGLPSLLCGILIVDHNGEMMNRAMADLARVARVPVDKILAEEGALSQVHAMNCIKDVLKNSRLGERSERYIPSALQLAADALHSDVWAIRNCGLMLFRAVIDRLLGTNDSFFGDDATGRRHLSSRQYPELVEVILDLLKRSSLSLNSSSVARNEGVFPALQLLQYAEVPDLRLEEVRESILALMANSSWHVRDTAARAYAFLVKLDTQEYRDLLCRTESGQNALHGSLLAAKHFITRIQTEHRESRLPEKAQTWQDLAGKILITTLDHYSTITNDNFCCPVSDAACLDVIRESLVLFASTIHDVKSQGITAHILDAGSDVDATRVLSLASVERSLDECGMKPGSAVVVQALARVYAVRLATAPGLGSSECASLVRLVSKFASIDEDACVYLLREIDNVSFLTDAEGWALIHQACDSVLRGSWGWELKQAAHNLLFRLSSHHTSPVLTEMADNKPLDLCSLVEPNQHCVDDWLQTQALQLEHEAVSSKTLVADGFLARVAAWTKDCALAIQGSNIFTPEAAAISLDRVDVVWHVLASEERSNPCLGELCVAVYDILNDDDEDIRLQAARIARRILRAQSGGSGLDYDPITASQRLLSFCIQRSSGNDQLITTAFERALGATVSGFRSVSERLAMYLQTDSALFVQERQNLYVDDAREVKVWSQAIMKLSTRASPQPFPENLAKWVVDGLDVLRVHARETRDGELGWSTNAEVFILGLQVIYGAEILLWQVRHNFRIAVQPSTLRQKLLDLAVACEASDVNCLWQWEMQRVLKESIVFKVERSPR